MALASTKCLHLSWHCLACSGERVVKRERVWLRTALVRKRWGRRQGRNRRGSRRCRSKKADECGMWRSWRYWEK